MLRAGIEKTREHGGERGGAPRKAVARWQLIAFCFLYPWREQVVVEAKGFNEIKKGSKRDQQAMKSKRDQQDQWHRNREKRKDGDVRGGGGS